MKLGIIPDGNRRYGERFNKELSEAYERGAETLETFLRYCMEEREDVEYITVYGLSGDNLDKRTTEELEQLLEIQNKYFKKLLDDGILEEKNVEVTFTGEWTVLDHEITETIEELIETTGLENGNNPDHILNFLFNFDSRHYGEIPELDLVIRTGRRIRLSGFPPMAVRYSELIFEGLLWPECRPRTFEYWFDEYAQRNPTHGA